MAITNDLSERPKPIFVIVPGAWHLPQSFEAVIKILNSEDYETKGVTLVSGSDSSIQSFDPDVREVEKVVEEVLEDGRDVILVMHSYGGVVGSEATKKFLDKAAASSSGTTRIVGMVWVTAFVLPAGTSVMDALGGKDLPWFMVDGNTVNPRDPKNVFYNDMNANEAEKFAQKLTPHAYRTFSSKVSFEPWSHPDVSTTYILCENDNAIPIMAQEGMIAGAQAKHGQAFHVVERMSASHTPFASTSQPEKLAGFLIKAAGEEIREGILSTRCDRRG